MENDHDHFEDDPRKRKLFLEGRNRNPAVPRKFYKFFLRIETLIK
jgi:hypothetical protein